MSFKFLDSIMANIKKLDSEIDEYKQVSKNPYMPSIAYVNWALHLAETGDLISAEEKLVSSTMMVHKTPEAYVNLGILKIKEKSFSEAKEFFIKALRMDNKNAKAYCFLGNALTEIGNYEEAEKKFIQATKIDPNNYDIMLNWGISLIKQRKFKEAKEKFKNACKFNKTNPTAIYFLGLIDLELGETQKAKEKFQMITKIDSNHYESFYYLAYIFYREDNYDKSLPMAIKSFEIYPKKIETCMLIAENYMQKENKEECLKYYTLGEKNCVTNYYFFISWGISLQHFKLYEEAKEKFQKTIEINTKNDLGHAYLGISFYELKDYDNAIISFKKALETNPSNIAALDNLGQIFFDKEDYHKAIEYFEAVTKHSARMFKNYGKIAKAYFLLGDNQNANKYYQKVLEYLPNEIGINIEYAKVLIAQKNYVYALKKLQNAYKIDNKNLDCLNLLFYTNYILAKENISDYNKEKAIAIAEEIQKNYPDKFAYMEEKKELEAK